ncbi:MAG: DNA-3-methyladenine glycosylase [Armatimonadota bacterium]|nr:DNA-3-methyladenine glycosylase [Armatimonadota bacterium]MDR5688395.1 DNA-3-methyladenine glycosylase [Armatimonadota bacterium]MDR7386705.1 DNA-3-methyladenine glycosylase [Armatimonadota bacterium]MDR7388544.1 DNA-3-methyladenine glycosylase [Armatimonadota bacterium]MDR7394117.1 DNA-3-methyladenine glycosylase [Armatimonadota bacterium]
MKPEVHPALAPPLPRSFFERPTLQVAPELLGCRLVRVLEPQEVPGGADGPVVLVARLVEVEAYLGPADPASHAYRRTPRSAIMWGPPGRAYVYFSYGNHDCMNVVTEPEGVAGAVLLRAAEPLEGVAVMRKLRGTHDVRQLLRGPGRLTKALAVDRHFNGWDLTQPGPLYLAGGEPPARVATSPRIGIRRAVDRPWRFFDPESPFVSR